MSRLAVALLLAAGCAHSRPAPRETTVQMDPIVFQAEPGGRVEMVDAASLFARASAAFGAKRFAEAAATFDRIVAEYPASRYVVPALYDAGLSLEGAGDLDAAAARYRRITVEHANAPDALDAWFRLGFVYTEAKSWAAAADTYAQILARRDLTLGDRIQAMTCRGVAQFSQPDLIAAERTLRDEQAYYQAHRDEERLDSDYFLAEGAYYLGEIAHQQYRALPVRLPEKQLARDLEAKARMLLVAQARFIDAMRVDNAEWATAAGYQIGSLYRELYDDLVGAPVPPALAGEARDVYLDEVRNRVKPLLERAISIHEKNVVMAERLGAKTEWVRRSNEQVEQLKKLLLPGAPPPAQPPEPVTPPAPPRPPRLRLRDDVTPHVVM